MKTVYLNLFGYLLVYLSSCSVSYLLPRYFKYSLKTVMLLFWQTAIKSDPVVGVPWPLTALILFFLWSKSKRNDRFHSLKKVGFINYLPYASFKSCTIAPSYDRPPSGLNIHGWQWGTVVSTGCLCSCAGQANSLQVWMCFWVKKYSVIFILTNFWYFAVCKSVCGNLNYIINVHDEGLKRQHQNYYLIMKPHLCETPWKKFLGLNFICIVAMW